MQQRKDHVRRCSGEDEAGNGRRGSPDEGPASHRIRLWRGALVIGQRTDVKLGQPSYIVLDDVLKKMEQETV